VAINCSAIPESLLESELFGHAKGSFTGAYEKKIGLFEEAQNGTLFLDEIGDLSLSLQAKLLRVIQERTIKRVGENTYRDINCRIISATHKDLGLEVNEHRFREDLYFRLNVIPIVIPPLRDRYEDLIPLAENFLKRFALENGSCAKTFSKEAIKFVLDNPWRGNVRELENVVERAVVLSGEPEVSLEDFMPTCLDLHTLAQDKIGTSTENMFFVNHSEHLPTLDDIIQKYIEYAVLKNGGAKDKTAKEIGIDRKTLYKRLRLL
jgi:DNA-binding NtrC family response regulator